MCIRDRSNGKYILFIDDDNVVDPKMISSLVGVIDSNESIGEVCPVMYFYNNPNKLFWAGTDRNMSTTRTYFTTNLSKHMQELTWDTDDAPNAYLVRANLFKTKKIKFKDNLGIMYEESDLAYRIRALGYSIKVVKDAKTFHDTEDWSTSGKKTSFLFHTMKDKRRPYYTARNRLIFHRLYSTNLQFMGIVLFWNWFFTFMYIMLIMFYSGSGDYSIKAKASLSLQYLRGVKDGLIFGINTKL